MTVFFCLMTLLISALICTCLESARAAGLRFMAQTAAGSSLKSVFAEYHEAIWDRYHVFFHHEPDGEEGVKQSLKEYLVYYTDPVKDLGGMTEYIDLWDLEQISVEVAETQTMLSQGGMLFLEQAAEYEKYQVATQMVELLLEQIGILDEAERFRSFALTMRGVFDQIQTISTVVQDVRDLVIYVSDSVNVVKELLYAEISSFEEFRHTVQSLRKLYGQLMESTSRYLDSVEGVATLAGNLRKEYGEGEKALFGEQIDSLGDLTETGSVGGAISRLRNQLSDICKDLRRMEDALNVLDSAQMPEEERMETIEELCREVQELLEDSLVLMSDTNTMFQESEERCLQERPENEQVKEYAKDGESLMDKVKQWKNTEVLSLVLGGHADRTRQDKLENTRQMPSKIRTESLPEVELWKKGLFAFYIGDSFTSWLSTKQGPFAYQQEYILFGKDDSRSNLTAMASSLLAVREGLNLVYVLTDIEMCELAETVAFALVGATGIYPLVLIVKFVLLAAWAFAEAVMDVKALFQGEKVELWKSKETWKTSVAGELEQKPKKENNSAGLTDLGLNFSYDDYLKLFLLLKKTEKLCLGSLDMIQADIAEEEPGFLLANCYGSAITYVEFGSSYRLITLPLIGVFPEDGHRLTVKAEYRYP